MFFSTEGEDGEMVEEVIGPMPKAAVQLTRKDFGKVRIASTSPWELTHFKKNSVV